MTKDRRESERFTPPESAVVYDSSSKRPIGKLANLSTDGAMLITSGPIKPASTLRCRMDLQPKIMDQGEVHFEIECSWCRRNVAMDRWESGYRLTAYGDDAYLLSYLVLGFKLCGWGDPSVHEVKTVEMPNRRRAVRFELAKPLPVYENRSHLPLGKVVDISLGGFRVVSEKPIEKGYTVDCWLQLPRKVLELEFLSLSIQCMWSRATSPGRYESGYQFVNVSKQDTAVVLHLMINFGNPRHGERKALVVG